MDENKELAERVNEISEEAADQVSTVEFEELPEKKENISAEPKAEKADKWGEKNVTRKFMVIALAAAILINAALTAGITGALLRKQAKDRPNMHGGGRPGNEMFFDDNQNGKGQMAPPGGNQNNGQGQEQSSKASIGIVIKDDSGVYVAQVTGDNAKKAGFKEGDKVVSIEGKDVSTSSDLINEVQSHKAGDTVTVTVERDGQAVEIKTELE